MKSYHLSLGWEGGAALQRARALVKRSHTHRNTERRGDLSAVLPSFANPGRSGKAFQENLWGGLSFSAKAEDHESATRRAATRDGINAEANARSSISSTPLVTQRSFCGIS